MNGPVCCFFIDHINHTRPDTLTSLQGGRGHWAVYYTSPQSFSIMFLIPYWLNNFEANFEFWLVGSWSWVSKRFKHLLQSSEGVIFCNIIGDVHQFMGHCLIPLDPWCVCQSQTIMGAILFRSVIIFFNWCIVFVNCLCVFIHCSFWFITFMTVRINKDILIYFLSVCPSVFANRHLQPKVCCTKVSQLFPWQIWILKIDEKFPFLLGALERLALTLLEVFIRGFFSQCFSVRRFFLMFLKTLKHWKILKALENTENINNHCKHWKHWET